MNFGVYSDCITVGYDLDGAIWGNLQSLKTSGFWCFIDYYTRFQHPTSYS